MLSVILTDNTSRKMKVRMVGRYFFLSTKIDKIQSTLIITPLPIYFWGNSPLMSTWYINNISGDREKCKDQLIESLRSKQTRTDAQIKQLREVRIAGILTRTCANTHIPCSHGLINVLSTFFISNSRQYHTNIYIMIWWFIVFNVTFSNNISVISWWSVLLGKETRVREDNHRHTTIHWQTLSHNVVSSTPRHEQSLNSQLRWW